AAGTVSEPAEASWTSKDSLLYALGVGAGATDPTGFELEFTTENTADVEQRALPTMPVVINASGGGNVMSAIGTFDWAMLVHGEQSVALHQPLPVAGTATMQGKVAAIYDKGKAAVVVLENEAKDANGKPLFTTSMSAFIRGEGGWGGDRGPSGPRNVAPDRDPDHVVSYDTRTDQALLYRLNGDRNPLHSDPSFAALAGFPKPILHGLCTYGFTGRALLHAVCGSDPARFKSMEGRFSTPVMPGDRLDVKIWVDGNEAIFQTCVGDNVVFDAGKLTFA
ncbi:MAG TPA: MaoC/PaaZ C-terminal domain-containing protein, partial [Acidimicrobiia bacterium]|nr:MaoC/PaaZ C-terminal domain-containing protein [Acidimicrobiia bacterium]